MRYNPIFNYWVAVSENRKLRQNDFQTSAAPMSGNAALSCPFCEGHEAETPHELDALVPETSLDDYRRPDGPGWMIRAIPNRFPFVTPDNEMTLQQVGPHLVAPDVGKQEVLVDVPFHAKSPSEMSAEEFQYLIHFYHRRMHQARKSARWKYVQLFKNQGRSAGASISHIHSQLAALPFVPPTIAQEQSFLHDYSERNGRCYHCEILDFERSAGWRWVCQTEFFGAFCPFASRFPGELHILPLRHVPCFVESQREELDDLAELLHRLLHDFEQKFNPPCYNLVFKTSPWTYDALGVHPDPNFHWRLEILPRTTHLAGFEFGTGCYVNQLTPENAAKRWG